jgi:hypothetical protein
MNAPTRGWPLPNGLIRLFQPLLRHRCDQPTQEGPLGFVFVSIFGLRFAIHAHAFRHPGLLLPYLKAGHVTVRGLTHRVDYWLSGSGRYRLR